MTSTVAQTVSGRYEAFHSTGCLPNTNFVKGRKVLASTTGRAGCLVKEEESFMHDSLPRVNEWGILPFSFDPLGQVVVGERT